MSAEEITRIIIIDDHVLVRTGLRLLLETRKDLNVVGEAGDIETAKQLAGKVEADLVLLDLDLGGKDGSHLIGEIRNAQPKIKILIVTGLRDPRVQQYALSQGALGIVEKEKSSQTLLEAIDHVLRGEGWVSPALLGRILEQKVSKSETRESGEEIEPLKQLTAREREVARLVIEAIGNEEIAARLGISKVTVRHHLTAVYSKLGVTDRLGLWSFALRHKLIQTRPQDE